MGSNFFGDIVVKGQRIYYKERTDKNLSECRIVDFDPKESSSEVYITIKCLNQRKNKKLINTAFGNNLFLSKEDAFKPSRRLNNQVNYRFLKERNYAIFHDKFFFNESADGCDDIKIRKYHPYHNGQNPKFNDYSKMLLDLKDDSRSSYESSLKRIMKKVRLYSNYIMDDVVVCIVPPHTPSSRQPGLKAIAKEFINAGALDGTDTLIRTKPIPKRNEYGGTRPIGMHRKTIKVRNYKGIEDKKILLIDDITTTGNTLEACKQILYQVGARIIKGFVLGETPYYRNMNG